MSSIFISYAKEDAKCTEQILTDLEIRGNVVYREPQSSSVKALIHTPTLEKVILGSTAVILVWSSSAAQSKWVEQQISFAQKMKKKIVVVVLDKTNLPDMLVPVTHITSQPLCINTVAQLILLLPAPDSTDPLIKFYEQAAHRLILERKKAIDSAAEMLRQDEHRENVLAVLAYLSSKDTIMGVREKAQKVLDADVKKPIPPWQRLDEQRHFFGVRCHKEHITYFDKRLVCSSSGTLVRTKADELRLRCEQCGEEVTTEVDCRGYR